MDQGRGLQSITGLTGFVAQGTVKKICLLPNNVLVNVTLHNWKCRVTKTNKLLKAVPMNDNQQLCFETTVFTSNSDKLRLRSRHGFYFRWICSYSVTKTGWPSRSHVNLHATRHSSLHGDNINLLLLETITGKLAIV